MMEKDQILRILAALGCREQPLSIEPFLQEEGGEPYDVWRITFPWETLVLKPAKGCEAEVYEGLFRDQPAYVPKICASENVNGENYLLMSYIPGENLNHCTREKLISALDALIAMQSRFWQEETYAQIGFTFSASLAGRNNRGNYLNDPELEQMYQLFLQEYASVPRTLCHDDLLPFNVIVDKDHAVFIDWEYGGILPYPVSLARLIAHGEEVEDSFFHMTDENRQFALDYYYNHFIAGKEIPREVYNRTMALFLFYEYCEWIYLGNRFADSDPVRFQHYYQKAKAFLRKNLFR